MGSFEMKGLSLAAPSVALDHPKSTHDMVLKKSTEALQNINKEGWLENAVKDVYKTATKEGRGSEDNIDWRAKCKAMEFSAMIAKGEVERVRQRLLERLMDTLL